MPDRPVLSNSVCDAALAVEYFKDPDCDVKIAAEVTRLYDSEHPGAGVSKIEAEVASEQLVNLRNEHRRANAAKEHADYTTEKQPTGKRLTPLTLHEWLNYLLFFAFSMSGIFVATDVLATYAADSGVIAAYEHSFVAAFLMAVPVMAGGQALKAVGGLQKNDAAKALYFSRLAKLTALSIGLFMVGAAITFAPSPAMDPATVAEALASGHAPKPDLFVAICKEVGPYLTLGGGLIGEITAAAVIGHRADAINAMGRAVSQDITVTQNLLDHRIAVLHRRIEACARKAGRHQADAGRHDAARAARIAAAQAYARDLKARYAAHKAQSDREFHAQLDN